MMVHFIEENASSTAVGVSCRNGEPATSVTKRIPGCGEQGSNQHSVVLSVLVRHQPPLAEPDFRGVISVQGSRDGPIQSEKFLNGTPYFAIYTRGQLKSTA